MIIHTAKNEMVEYGYMYCLLFHVAEKSQDIHFENIFRDAEIKDSCCICTDTSPNR